MVEEDDDEEEEEQDEGNDEKVDPTGTTRSGKQYSILRK
jgi:hypothetical protein